MHKDMTHEELNALYDEYGLTQADFRRWALEWMEVELNPSTTSQHVNGQNRISNPYIALYRAFFTMARLGFKLHKRH